MGILEENRLIMLLVALCVHVGTQLLVMRNERIYTKYFESAADHFVHNTLEEMLTTCLI